MACMVECWLEYYCETMSFKCWYGHCSLEFSGDVDSQGGHVKIVTIYSVLWIGSEENTVSPKGCIDD